MFNVYVFKWNLMNFYTNEKVNSYFDDYLFMMDVILMMYLFKSVMKTWTKLRWHIFIIKKQNNLYIEQVESSVQ